ncbi:MAG TPA: hypothetical protein VK601_05055, partial [Kofleriaceae bacterium]|nr:hypothetical protein [Kofleriaceae bacterium]
MDCKPPEDLRLALLGLRCEVSGAGLRRIGMTMADAEELMGSAPRGSILWAQGIGAYIEGSTLAGRIPDLLAAVALLREVEPAPEAISRMALAFLVAICVVDVLGRVPEGSALADRFTAVVRSTGEAEPLARFWWHVAIGMRASYAEEDPWRALHHCEAIQAIYDVIGGDRVYLNMQLFRGLNLWYLGALAPAQRLLEDVAAADTSLGVASSLRRFGLAWLLADRGALEPARALAAQLADYGRAHRLQLEEYRGRWALAEVLRRSGDFVAAERELDAALAMTVPALEYPGVLATLSALRLAQGRAGDALATAETAVERCVAMAGCGMFRGAFVRLAHAEALDATGAHDAARLAIGDARVRLFGVAARIADP